MSDGPVEHPVVRQEEDRLPLAATLGAVVAVLVCVAVGVVWVLALLRPVEAELERSGQVGGPGVRVGPYEVSDVDQTLIAVDRMAERNDAEARARLHRYGWVDRERGLVHIPIDAAMDVLAGDR